jgi:triacylglycerol lipase
MHQRNPTAEPIDMLAQLQRFTTFSLLACALAWALWMGVRGHLAWAATGAIAIVMSYALVLALEFVLMHIVNRHDPAPRARPGQVLNAWAKEVVTTPWVFYWWQPFRSNAIPDQWAPRPPHEVPQRGVLLVHGLVCNRGVWTPWLRRLRDEKRVFLAVNLEPVFGSIDDYAQTIDVAVSRLTQCTGQPPLVVAHSMGGLAVRAWLQSRSADKRVHHVITMASPHQGTWLGALGHGVNTAQMRLDSAWLKALAAAEPASRCALFTCFYSHCDNIVFPASTACLPGARQVHLTGRAHVQMAHDEEVFQEVLRQLRVTTPGHG